ncbi:MAG: LysR family transcriptional regulator [Peptococcaceae bacterium]|jgi:DNA-binding transcriptional LysR family regulator|nr:LysR family transcriptional regulator [Peptococcaceae bacterium]MBQ5703248.1 LysR family transcriptional regulator [Peptococcaceae bacterium]
MNIDQLKYLVDLAKTSSMNTTAKRMFISQQALSESMKRLEKELDCTLLTRSKTGVMFTEDGMAVLESAQNMLKHYQVMMDYLKARHEKEHVRGKISLGIAPAATVSFLPELLQQFQTHYPDVTLYVREHAADQILDLLEQGEIDFGIFSYTETDVAHTQSSPDTMKNTFQFKQLYSDTLVCAMCRNNPLSSSSSISQEHLEQAKQTRYAYTSVIKPGNLCLHVSNNTNLHQQFMREEGTVCCIPYQLFHALYSSKEFHCIPIEDTEPVICTLAYKKESILSGSAVQQIFIDAVQAVVTKIYTKT